MEEKITITRSQLIEVLRKWDADAQAGNWADRTDDDRFADNADYLIGLITA